jgi:hypothetical protein
MPLQVYWSFSGIVLSSPRRLQDSEKKEQWSEQAEKKHLFHG